jgi:toxin ParE1/3/4
VAHTVIWSPRAIDDVDGIAAYIAEDSEAYAASVVRTILEITRRLPESPNIGRIVPEFGDEAIREVFAYSYRIIYRINKGEILVAAIIHDRRLLDLSVKP